METEQNIKSKKIILASSSPRRIAMLKEYGINPIVIPPDVDEYIPPGTQPHVAVMFLALKKALYVESIVAQEGCAGGDAIIAADTIVLCDDCIIGKPCGPEEAFSILKKLRGRKHTVITGVAMILPAAMRRTAFYEKSDVFFKSYPDSAIEQYVSTPEPYDKAGGYAVQGAWGKYVDRIEGDLSNVIGLPLDLVVRRFYSLNQKTR